MTREVKKCRSCDAAVVWLVTDRGKSMPVDAETVAVDDTTFDPRKHRSHFATCPDANQHRKPRK